MAMSRQALLEWFSTDEEIEAYHVGDDTVELCGYIDCLEGTQMVKTSYSNDLTEFFKMYVSNGHNRKIKVVMWGKNATKFAPMLSEKAIIRIRRAKAGNYNARFRSIRDDTNCEVELTVGTNSSIECLHGTFDDGSNQESTAKVPEVLLSEVFSSTGPVQVEGWIKVPFETTTCYGGSRGSGVIVDHNWRMRVHVTVFNPRPELTVGTRVQIVCQYKNDGGSVLVCNKVTDIKIKEENRLAAEEIRKMGLHTPKRKAEDGLAEQMAKKSA